MVEASVGGAWAVAKISSMFKQLLFFTTFLLLGKRKILRQKRSEENGKERTGERFLLTRVPLHRG
jgi:hypothetical protein